MPNDFIFFSFYSSRRLDALASSSLLLLCFYVLLELKSLLHRSSFVYLSLLSHWVRMVAIGWRLRLLFIGCYRCFVSENVFNGWNNIRSVVRSIFCGCCLLMSTQLIRVFHAFSIRLRRQLDPIHLICVCYCKTLHSVEQSSWLLLLSIYAQQKSHREKGSSKWSWPVHRANAIARRDNSSREIIRSSTFWNEHKQASNRKRRKPILFFIILK